MTLALGVIYPSITFRHKEGNLSHKILAKNKANFLVMLPVVALVKNLDFFCKNDNMNI